MNALTAGRSRFAPNRQDNEVSMAKGIVEVHGQEVEVREDTYKAYRGVRWAIICIVVFAAVVAVLFLAGFFTAVKKGDIQSPAQTERPAQ